jgi:hypothetical protein
VKQQQPRLVQLGLFLIVIANISNWFLLRHHPSLGDAATGAIMGVLYGAAIATMLVGLRRRRSCATAWIGGQRDDDGPPAAPTR